MDDRVGLTELVCARLCHDLAGLLGGLLGTLELVAEEAGATEAMSIATDTANVLAMRLKLLRAAWAGQPESLDLPQLTVLARGLAARRVGLDVSGMPPETVFTPAVGRLVLNLLLLAADSLPRGGVLRLDGDAADVIARLIGPGAAWPTGLIGMLVDAQAAWQALDDPRTMQAPLTALLARHHGVRLTVLLPTDRLPTDPTAAAPPPLRLTIG
jgi:histidine phosphotransferase ChpT